MNTVLIPDAFETCQKADLSLGTRSDLIFAAKLLFLARGQLYAE